VRGDWLAVRDTKSGKPQASRTEAVLSRSGARKA